MKLDDLKTDWQQKIDKVQSAQNFKETMTTLTQNIQQMDAQIKRRDRLEIGVAIALIPVWIIGLFMSSGLIQSIGFIIAILSCIYIPYKMQKAKNIAPQKSHDMRAYLQGERQKVLQQKHMLESILWWYLGPLGLSIALMTIGANVDEAGMPILSTFTIVYLCAVVVLYAGIYALNKQAAKKKFAPLLTRIDKQIAELEH